MARSLFEDESEGLPIDYERMQSEYILILKTGVSILTHACVCICMHVLALTMVNSITRYGSTLYIEIAMVVPIPQYIRKCQFLLSVSSEFDF